MSFKRTALCLFLILSSALTAGAKEKWNIVIAQWEDLSSKKDDTAGIILRKSVISELSQNPNFQVMSQLKLYPVIRDWDEALIEGRTNQADVIIYGTYYVEGEKISVSAEVFDVLNEQVKLRKTYSGEVTIEIFDTINKITADLAENVSAVLPEFTTESEVEIQKIRQVVYAKNNVMMKRTFYTRIGFITESGLKTSYYAEGSSGDFILAYRDAMPVYHFQAGLGLRFSDFRMDVLACGFPGMPSYLITSFGSNFGSNPNAPTFWGISFTYYLPFWNHSLAIGYGYHDGYAVKGFNTSKVYESGIVEFDFTSLSVLGHCLQFYFNPGDRWEFAFFISPVPQYSTARSASGDRSAEWTYRKAYLPNMGGTAAFFFSPSWGIETGFQVAHYYSTGSWDSDIIFSEASYEAEIVMAMAYLNIVYRLDFK